MAQQDDAFSSLCNHRHFQLYGSIIGFGFYFFDVFEDVPFRRAGVLRSSNDRLLVSWRPGDSHK